MKGFSLIEFLAGSGIFLAILLLTYPSIESQKAVLSTLIRNSRPEEESDYRLLILKNLLQDSGSPFRSDPLLEQVPRFFPDLDYGSGSRADAFTVIRGTALIVPFETIGKTQLSFPVPFDLEIGDTVALAGLAESGKFDWNYARITEVFSKQRYGISCYLNHSALLSGSCMRVEVCRFLYKSSTLYSVTESGQLQPFLGTLQSFRYSYRQNQLSIFWRIDSIDANITATL